MLPQNVGGLILRSWRESDTERYWELIKASPHLQLNSGVARRAMAASVAGRTPDEQDKAGLVVVEEAVKRRIDGPTLTYAHAPYSLVLAQTTDPDAILGSVTCWRTERTGVVEVGVWASAPGLGLGTLLTAYGTQIAFDYFGAGTVELATTASNKPMIRLARSLEFREVGEVERLETGGATRARMVQYLFDVTRESWRETHATLFRFPPLFDSLEVRSQIPSESPSGPEIAWP
jgi:RimJ/RimL family protein N-acetyltransferase